MVLPEVQPVPLRAVPEEVDGLAYLTFYDGLILGAILLTTAFGLLFFGLMFVPAAWIPLALGWPILAGVAAAYLPVKEAITAAIRGPGVYYPQFGPRVRQEPPTYCRVCGTALEYTGYRRGYCTKCSDYR